MWYQEEKGYLNKLIKALKLYVEWNDRSTSSLDQRELKESHPALLAEYVLVIQEQTSIQTSIPIVGFV